VDKFRGDVECLVEDREQSVTLALEDLELRVTDELDLLFEEVDVRKRVAVTAEEEGRTLDARPVLGAELVREAGTVQRIREEHKSSELGLDRGHARDASTEGLPTTDDLASSTRRLDEDGDRFLRGSARKVDRDRVDSTSLEANDVRLHRRGVT